jgi:hypothetical protein
VSSTTFFNATVTPGSLAIVTNAPASSTQFFTATITARNVIEAYAIASGGTFYPATITLSGTATIQASRIESSVQFFGAVVNGGVVSDGIADIWWTTPRDSRLDFSTTSNEKLEWRATDEKLPLDWTTDKEQDLRWRASKKTRLDWSG